MTPARLSGPKPSGFAMMELIVVLLIISVVAGMAVPSFVRAMPGQRLQSGMRDLFASARYARSEAVIKGIKHRIAIDPSIGEFWIEWEADPFEAPGTFEEAEGAWGRKHRLHDTLFFRDIAASGAAAADSGIYCAEFRPDGTAGADMVLVLSVEGDEEESVGLSIRALTGLSRIVEGDELAASWSALSESSE